MKALKTVAILLILPAIVVLVAWYLEFPPINEAGKFWLYFTLGVYVLLSGFLGNIVYNELDFRQKMKEVENTLYR